MELENTNKRLEDCLKNILDSNSENVETGQLLKFANFLATGVKKNSGLEKSFKEIFESEEILFFSIKTGNLTKTCMNLLQFALENLEEFKDPFLPKSKSFLFTDQNSSERINSVKQNFSECEEWNEISIKSDEKAENMSEYKQKVQRIHESTIEKPSKFEISLKNPVFYSQD